MSRLDAHRGRLLAWGGFLAAMIVLPIVFNNGFSVSLLCQIGIMTIFALSYNMLLGQTGLLSFGHAVYYGLGAIFTLHALNLVSKGAFAMPVTLLPLVGGVAGLIFGVIFGYVTTKRAGTVFAMISLGIGEMVAASSLMFPGFFGGEGGISGNRVAGKALLGITYGPQIQMYYLIAGWVFVSVVAMFALTQTPLGRMANAVRDNPERAQFVGYDPHRVRFMMLALSGFFAGVAGGLTGLNYEIVTAESLNAHTSGIVLLMAFVGGAGYFFGPIIGAVLISVMQIALSGLTKAWLFYFGLFFLGMVLYAPGGIASIVMLHMRLWKARLLGWLVPAYLLAAVPAAIFFGGLIAIVEMAYEILGESGSGETHYRLFGFTLDATAISSWLWAGLTVAAGFALLRLAGRQVAYQWHNVHAALHRGSAA